MGNSRGSVGKAFSRRKRYWEDDEYRERIKEKNKKFNKKYYQRKKEKIKKYNEELNIFANKKCKKCGKLLNYRTKSGFCNKHYKGGRKRKNENKR